MALKLGVLWNGKILEGSPEAYKHLNFKYESQ